MTNFIINPNPQLCAEYLVTAVNQLLTSEYTQVSQLAKNPDIHIIENTQHASISIDEVKKLQKEMIFQPFEEQYQIGIIFHADNLTAEAQNALLKTLEEDTDTTVYMLLIQNETNMLETILSRGVKHYVKSESEETYHMNTKNDSFNNTSTESSTIERPEILDLDLIEQFKQIEQLIETDKEDKNSVKEFLHQLAKYYREEIRKAIRHNDFGKGTSMKKVIEEISTAHERINANGNKRLALENLIITISHN